MTQTSTAHLPVAKSPEAPQAQDPRVIAARARLDRLETFLREDPQNNAMLIDAFQTALSCGEWEHAEFHLKHAQSLQSDALAWRLREGDLLLAQQRFDEAASVLEALAATPNPPTGLLEVVLHNLAYVELRRGNPSGCIARLESIMDALAAGPGPDQAGSGKLPAEARALQQLWLRALHHELQLDRAMAWTHAASRQGRLDPQAAGIASLIAIDASDFQAAEQWSTLATTRGNVQEQSAEAFVAQASLALAARDAMRALQLADAALERHPGDGRAWSTRGFAALLANDAPAAIASFKRALTVMGQHVGTWHGLGWAQILQGDLAAAKASFETALELDRNFGESHGGLAVVLALQSQREEALVHTELALRLDNANASGRYAQALLSGEVNSAADLQRLARRLLGGRPAPLGGDMADMLPEQDAPGHDAQP